MKKVRRISKWAFVMILLTGISIANLQAQNRKPHFRHELPDSARMDKMMDHLSSELKLTDDQMAAIANSFHQHFKAVETVRERHAESREQERQEIEKLKESLDGAVIAVLTPEQQEQFKEFQKNRRPQHPDGPPSPSKGKSRQGKRLH